MVIERIRFFAEQASFLPACHGILPRSRQHGLVSAAMLWSRL
jgi:hypothetical protein